MTAGTRDAAPAVEHGVPRLALSAADAARATGISRSELYALAAREEGPPSFRIGRRRLWPVEGDGLKRWIAERVAQEARR